VKEMSDKPVKIVFPKDPVQIGKTPDGKPIWVDPKDMMPTEDDKLQTKENLLNSREHAAIHKMTQAVFVNAGRFVQDTFYHIAPREVIEAHEDSKMGKVAEWVASVHYEVIQDGLTTVVKVGGKVVRSMVANIGNNCADLVDRNVRKIFASKN
jgi:hypothetical protein